MSERSKGKSYPRLTEEGMATARMLHAPKWNDILIPTMDDWLKKLVELAAIVKLTALIN